MKRFIRVFFRNSSFVNSRTCAVDDFTEATLSREGFQGTADMEHRCQRDAMRGHNVSGPRGRLSSLPTGCGALSQRGRAVGSTVTTLVCQDVSETKTLNDNDTLREAHPTNVCGLASQA